MRLGHRFRGFLLAKNDQIFLLNDVLVEDVGVLRIDHHSQVEILMFRNSFQAEIFLGFYSIITGHNDIFVEQRYVIFSPIIFLCFILFLNSFCGDMFEPFLTCIIFCSFVLFLRFTDIFKFIIDALVNEKLACFGDGDFLLFHHLFN